MYFSGGELSFYGSTPQPLEVASYKMGSTTIGDYAVFGGGVGTTVTAYDKRLTKIVATEKLDNTGYGLAAAITNNYVIFAGGNVYPRKITAYRKNLTKTSISQLSGNGAYEWKGAKIGNYALFPDGRFTQSYVNSNAYAFDDSLTEIIASSTGTGRYEYGMNVISNKVVILGGSSTNAKVEVYDSSFTKQYLTNIANERMRSRIADAKVGDHILFAGGTPNRSPYASQYVDVYDKSLTYSTLTCHSTSAAFGASLPDFAIIAGGQNSSGSSYTNYVSIFDASLVRTVTQNDETARYYGATATIGDYALLAGGMNGPTNKVLVYQEV